MLASNCILSLYSIVIGIFTLFFTSAALANGLERAQYPSDNNIKRLKEVASNITHRPSPPPALKGSNRPLSIINYYQEDGRPAYVMINGGRDDGIVEGAIFYSYRRAPSPSGEPNTYISVKTGILKTFKLKNNFALARIVSEETMLSKTFFPRFPGVMSGDWVTEKKVQLVKKRIVAPMLEVSYFDIFRDPKSYPNTFELTEKGKNRLRKIASYYSSMKLPLLLIEAYTDRNGPADANQVESYQRALTVRQYFIEELGFDPNRVVAIGYGELEPVDDSYASGYRRNNRRLSFKVKSLER